MQQRVTHGPSHAVALPAPPLRVERSRQIRRSRRRTHSGNRARAHLHAIAVNLIDPARPAIYVLHPQRQRQRILHQRRRLSRPASAKQRAKQTHQRNSQQRRSQAPRLLLEPEAYATLTRKTPRQSSRLIHQRRGHVIVRPRDRFQFRSQPFQCRRTHTRGQRRGITAPPARLPGEAAHTSCSAHASILPSCGQWPSCSQAPSNPQETPRPT